MQEIALGPRLVEQVYRALLEAICDGTLPPGARLTQEALAERFNVSRQPIGQALALLKSQGFVSAVGRRGLVVSALDPSVVRALYEVRGALDRLAARKAAQNARPEAQAQGEALLERGRRALASRSVSELIAADIAFHGFIAELSGNPLVGQTMAFLWDRLRPVMSAYLEHADWAEETWREHAELLRLILSGRAEEAEQTASAHVENAVRLLEIELAKRAQRERAEDSILLLHGRAAADEGRALRSTGS